MNYPNLREDLEEIVKLSLEELIERGISIKQKNLLYGKYENGYIVVYCNHDLDVFLTSRLPKEEADNKKEFVLLECLSYRKNKEDKCKIVNEIFEKAGKRID